MKQRDGFAWSSEPRSWTRSRRPAFVAVFVWLAVGLSCSPPLLGGAPTVTPAPSPSATAATAPDEEPTGGFGASSAWWDAHHERTGTFDGGFVYDDRYEVQFARDHARWLNVVISENPAVPASEVETLARALMPDDAGLNCDFDPHTTSVPETFSFSCWSIWLSYQFAEADWQGAPNGSFIVLYTLRDDSVTSLLLTTGSPP